MNDRLQPDMLEAIRLTRAGRLTEATALLQRALRSEPMPGTASGATGEGALAPTGRNSRIIDLIPETIELTDPQPSPRTGHASGTSSRPAGPTPGTAQPHLPQALRRFLERVKRIHPEPGVGGLAGRTPAHAPAVVPEGGQFLVASYSNEAGSRVYKLYVPSDYRGQAIP